jgi:hypothetical protein
MKIVASEKQIQSCVHDLNTYLWRKKEGRKEGGKEAKMSQTTPQFQAVPETEVWKDIPNLAREETSQGSLSTQPN